MTLTQLQYLLALEQYGSFQEAAKRSFVTQPTLSIQLQKLEEELAVQIFDRSRHPIVATDIGKKLLAQARVIMNETQKVQDIIHAEQQVVAGEFRLAIIPSVAGSLVPLFFKHFVENYPQVQLVIDEMKTETLIEALVHGEIDGAICSTPLKHADIHERSLYYEPFYVYSHPRHHFGSMHDIQRKDLAHENILFLSEGHCFRNQVQELCKIRAQVADHEATSLQSGNFQTLIQLVDQGMGLTFLPYLVTEKLSARQKKRIKQFRAPQPVREISFVMHRTAVKESIYQAICEQIIASLPRALLAQKKRQNVLSP